MTIRLIAAASTALLSLAAHAAPNLDAADGMPAGAAASLHAHAIVIDERTRYVNVYDGETVRFVQGAHSFDWTFRAREREGVVALGRLDPQDFGASQVKVYVAPGALHNDA